MSSIGTVVRSKLHHLFLLRQITTSLSKNKKTLIENKSMVLQAAEKNMNSSINMMQNLNMTTLVEAPPTATSTKPSSTSSSSTFSSTSDGDSSGPSEILKLMWRVNSFLMQDFRTSEGSACIPLLVGYRQIGLLSPKVVKILARYPHVFLVSSTSVVFRDLYSTYESRSAAIASVLADIRKSRETVALRSWRDELFTVWGHYGTEPLFEIERSAVALLGIRAFGVHITGYVKNPEDGSVAGVWLQKRADNKPTYPGMLDTMVGGLITAGLTASQTVIKEAAEEASIPPQMIDRVQPVGTVSFFTETARGLHANTEHVHDLELPPNYVPKNSDGEVQDFKFVETKDILDYVLNPNYKLTSTPILIDFLIRHGIITSDLIPDFPEVVELLHVSLNLHYRMWPKIKSFCLNNIACSSPISVPSSVKMSDTDESDSYSFTTDDSTSLARLDSHDDEVYY